MDAASVARVAYNAGWRGQDLIDAIAYAGIESSFNEDARSSTGCCGLWQLCPCVSTDPQANANAAYAKWQAAGSTFDKDWTPYDQGRANPNWQQFYSQAVAVVSDPSLLLSPGPGLPNNNPNTLKGPGVGNPFDSLGNVLASIFNNWQTMGTRVLLTFLGVLVVTIGLIILVFGDLKTPVKDVAEIAIL